MSSCTANSNLVTTLDGTQFVFKHFLIIQKSASDASVNQEPWILQAIINESAMEVWYCDVGDHMVVFEVSANCKLKNDNRHKNNDVCVYVYYKYLLLKCLI